MTKLKVSRKIKAVCVGKLLGFPVFTTEKITEKELDAVRKDFLKTYYPLSPAMVYPENIKKRAKRLVQRGGGGVKK